MEITHPPEDESEPILIPKKSNFSRRATMGMKRRADKPTANNEVKIMPLEEITTTNPIMRFNSQLYGEAPRLRSEKLIAKSSSSNKSVSIKSSNRNNRGVVVGAEKLYTKVKSNPPAPPLPPRKPQPYGTKK